VCARGDVSGRFLGWGRDGCDRMESDGGDSCACDSGSLRRKAFLAPAQREQSKAKQAKQGGYLRLRLRPCGRPQVHPIPPCQCPCECQCQCQCQNRVRASSVAHARVAPRDRKASQQLHATCMLARGRAGPGTAGAGVTGCATGLAAGNGQRVGLVVRRERARAVGSVRWGWAGRSKRSTRSKRSEAT
jgi:hypothetical protein